MEKILRDCPETLETARLILRCPRPGDGPELYAATAESLAELRPWLPWALGEPSVEASEAFARRAQVDFLAREDLTWLLTLRETGQLLGVISLQSIQWDVPKFEIGYWLRTSCTGQGYMAEAAAAVAELAFGTFGARRVEIRCDSRNSRSAAVARRLGFEHEGTIRCDELDHVTGEPVDTMIFARIKQT